MLPWNLLFNCKTRSLIFFARSIRTKAMSGSGCLNHFYFSREPDLYGEPWHLDFLPGLELRDNAISSAPPIICIGAGATFGRHAARPFAAQLDAINLGIGAASPATFLDPRLLDVINKAKRVIVQIPTARNESTRLWSQQLNKIGLPFDSVANCRGWLMHANEAWKIAIEDQGTIADRITEARVSWIRKMRRLLHAIKPPTTLLWLSSREPSYEVMPHTLYGIYNVYPQMVTQFMVNQIKPLSDQYVECIWDANLGEYYPTQEAHNQATRLLRG